MAVIGSIFKGQTSTRDRVTVWSIDDAQLVDDAGQPTLDPWSPVLPKFSAPLPSLYLRSPSEHLAKSPLSPQDKIARWSTDDSQTTDSSDLVVSDPWSQLATRTKTSLSSNLVPTEDFICANFPIDPWSPIPDPIQSKEIAPAHDSWDDTTTAIPDFDRNLRKNLWDARDLDRRRFSNSDTRIRWLMALIGPVGKHRSRKLESALKELFALMEDGQRLFRSLCDLALETEEAEDFANALSFRQWWSEHSEYWLCRNRSAGSFYFDQSGFNAMSWPMCIRIARMAKTFCWEALPIDDWLVEWKACRTIQQGSWTFAQWIHDKITMAENYEQRTTAEMQDAHSDVVVLNHPILTGFPILGANVGPSAYSTCRWESNRGVDVSHSLPGKTTDQPIENG